MKRIAWIALLFCMVNMVYSQDSTSPPQELALVPAENLFMGSDRQQPIAQPRIPVSVDVFNMDVHEVTNKQYTNPEDPAHVSFRVMRGGGWHSGPGCTSVHHRNALPTLWVEIAGGFPFVKDVKEHSKSHEYV